MRNAIACAVLFSCIPSAEADGDTTHGTCVKWEESIDAAAEMARRDGKLVMVMHISGHFQDPGRT